MVITSFFMEGGKDDRGTEGRWCVCFLLGFCRIENRLFKDDEGPLSSP